VTTASLNRANSGSIPRPFRDEGEARRSFSESGKNLIGRLSANVFQGFVMFSMLGCREFQRSFGDETAIKVFAEKSENSFSLLLRPKAVLGIDPGIRTGCKLAVVDDSGKFIATA